MRVAMYYNNHDIRIEEMPIPVIGPGELLLKVIACGICGSDVMEWYRLKKAPRVLGHEVTGDVIEVGAGVERYKVGDRISVTHHVSCNTCRYCLRGQQQLCQTLRSTNFEPGGFSEYLRVPAINVDRGVLVLPDDISYEIGTFIEPIGCATRGLQTARLQPGKSVLVLGSGVSGLLLIMLARAFGAGPIIGTDIEDYRLTAALRCGADASFDARTENLSEEVYKTIGNRGADIVIICTAAPSAFKQALDLVDAGGTVMLFALNSPETEVPLKLFDFWNKSITLLSTYHASLSDLSLALDLLRIGSIPVANMITHRLPLEETGKGFELVEAAQESIKVIIEPQK